MNCLNGVGVALVTPFKDCGAVDYDALKLLVEDVIVGGVDYLVPLGTTAETATLSTEEKLAVLKCVMDVNASRKPVVVGIGGNNTAEVCSQIKQFDFTGITALLSVTPYYNKPSQEGIYRHYKAVAEVSPVPVVLYNVPGRTGVNMCAQTTLRLAHDFKNVVAIKEASGNLNQVAYILRDRPEGFKVISGDDNLALALITQGGDGVISVAANCFTKKFCDMIHSVMAGEMKTAQTGFYELVEAVDLLFKEGNPIGAKVASNIKGKMNTTVRLPLVEATDSLKKEIKQQIEKYGL